MAKRLNSRLRSLIVKKVEDAVPRVDTAEASKLVIQRQLYEAHAGIKEAYAENPKVFHQASEWIGTNSTRHMACIHCLPLNVRPARYKTNADWFRVILKAWFKKYEDTEIKRSKLAAAARVAVDNYTTIESLLGANPHLSKYVDQALAVDGKPPVESKDKTGSTLANLLKQAGALEATDERKPIPQKVRRPRQP